MKTNITQKQKGFTMIELMVALLIAGILTSYAIPAYREFGLRQKISNLANSLLGDLAYARVSAIKEGQNVVVLSDAGLDWSKGWQIFIDKDGNNGFNAGDTLLRVSQSVNQNIVFSGDAKKTIFNNLGAAKSVVNITINHAKTLKKVIINVSASGMVSSHE